MSTSTFTSNLPHLSPSAPLAYGPLEIDAPKDFSPRKTYRPLTLSERISYRLGCGSHSWSMPRTRQGQPLEVNYPWKAHPKDGQAIFDAHQTCHSCGAQRFFNLKLWVSGPMFKRTDEGSRSCRSQAPR